ncbi:EAL domain-containing protein [Pseudoalteromonas ruthenica]|nr:EAL domain-containing protein [Pseudoalteromonas ruthenica]TMO90219.1 GGDEF-domain containing protein [Pseudoalteromonas ruthenica]TMO92076.1 GGDEF-domain containing protein [Pseudoalteromonas ruthenica]TMO99540.1 GGDEF-domain containing protein [Pseudoalteromonas ruthenica]TMP06641.1 GGDEF-domain containing protein [Pseudoalteromonas ruthenica]TMP10903.1 GGDEF-domain containing protein [Pseudoalteromonas ruthenica]
MLLHLFATPSQAHVNDAGYGYQLQRLSTDEGLSQGSVSAIAQDDFGYMWFATGRGLNRYDGYKVTLFESQHSALSSDFILTMLKLANGKLLVSTQFSGVYLVDPATLTSKQIIANTLSEHKIDYVSVSAIAQDPLNPERVWLGLNHHIFSLDLTDNSLTHAFSIANETHIIRALLPHQDGLYVGASNGLYHYQQGRVKQINYLPKSEAPSGDQQNVKLLRFDSEFGLMIGTVEGLYSMSLSSPNTFRTLLPSYNIWGFQRYGLYDFIATDEGLKQFNRQSLRAQTLVQFSKSRFAVSDNSIQVLFRDKGGMIWLSSRSQGVYSWSPLSMRFRQRTLPSGQYKHGHIAWGMYEQADGTLWVGSDNGLNRLSANGESEAYLVSKDDKLAIGQQTIYRIFPATHQPDSLWLESSYGSELFNIKTSTLTRPLEKADRPQSFDPQSYYGGLVQLPDNRAFFIAPSGFYMYDPEANRITDVPALNRALLPDLATHFLSPLPNHPNDPLLSHSGTLYRYDTSRQQVEVVYESANTNPQHFNYIDGWTVDQNNSLWLSIDNEGLVALDMETLEVRARIGLEQGLKNLGVYTPVVDDLGYLWFGSNNGLYRLNINSEHVRYFTVEDGLSASEFNAFAVLKRGNGELVFGTVKGLLEIDPTDFVSGNTQYIAPPPQITNIDLLSRSIDYSPISYIDKPLQLQHDDLGLTISFSSFNFLHRSQVRYRISLSGASDFTYNDYKDNTLQFAKLNPGRHELSIRAFDPVSGKYSREARLIVNVAYAPWRSPLAKTMYALLAIAIIGAWLMYLRAQQRKLRDAHSVAVNSQQQTNLALQSSNSGVWHYYVSERQFAQRRLSDELGYANSFLSCSFEQHAELIHPHDVERYRTQWKRFLKQGEQGTWECTYRIAHSSGEWLWYHEVGRITECDLQGHARVVSGIYTNITDAKASAQQATVLGEAISQISDWLLILDEHMQPFSANHSFLQAFASQQAPQLNIQPFVRALGKHKYKKYMSIIGRLKAGQNWRCEEQIRTKHNRHHPVQISVTAVCRDNNDNRDEVSYYVIVITDLTEQKRAEDELRYLANYDPLTGLPNRTMMRSKISQAIDYAKENASLLALLFIDLDKFKPVNDSFGHAVGDQVLCCICERISEQLDDNALLARQSGDEFLLLIEHVHSPQMLSEFAEHLAKVLEQPIKIGNITINISVSVGIALSPFDADNAEDLIRNADMAMIHAKNAGRNGYKFFTEQMNNRITHKLMLENALQDAYRDEVLLNHYQPIVHDFQKRIVGVELLLRWPHEGTFISPGEFIPIAEEIGLIDAITEQALHRALRDLKPWFESSDDFYLSLNLSPIHILKSNLSDRLQDILALHHVSPTQLRLEITENTLLEDKTKAAEQLNRLHSAGFKLFLDDFGTGFSSLTYLSQFPIDVIKIDQSFVRQIGVNPTNESIIRTIHNLARSLGLYCVAEGVETREQIFFLNKLGCHHLQGFFFARPVDAQTLLSSEFIDGVIDKTKSL